MAIDTFFISFFPKGPFFAASLQHPYQELKLCIAGPADDHGDAERGGQPDQGGECRRLNNDNFVVRELPSICDELLFPLI